MNPPPLFEFESQDASARWLVWLMPLLCGGAILAVFYDFGGMQAILAVMLAAAVLGLGLRSSISVRPGEVTIVRKWFFLPYRTHRATEIEDVWYGGDRGDEEGALGVVVKLGGKEIEVGKTGNMRELHNALFRLSARYRQANGGV